MSAMWNMALVCRHQDKDDVGGGKGQRRSEPRGEVHYYRFERMRLAFKTAKLVIITHVAPLQRTVIHCSNAVKCSEDLSFCCRFEHQLTENQLTEDLNFLHACRHDSRVEAASTKLTESEIKEAQAPEQVAAADLLTISCAACICAD